MTDQECCDVCDGSYGSDSDIVGYDEDFELSADFLNSLKVCDVVEIFHKNEDDWVENVGVIDYMYVVDAIDEDEDKIYLRSYHPVYNRECFNIYYHRISFNLGSLYNIKYNTKRISSIERSFNQIKYEDHLKMVDMFERDEAGLNDKDSETNDVLIEVMSKLFDIKSSISDGAYKDIVETLAKAYKK